MYKYTKPIRLGIVLLRHQELPHVFRITKTTLVRIGFEQSYIDFKLYPIATYDFGKASNELHNHIKTHYPDYSLYSWLFESQTKVCEKFVSYVLNDVQYNSNPLVMRQQLITFKMTVACTANSTKRDKEFEITFTQEDYTDLLDNVCENDLLKEIAETVANTLII